jgi:hypothetical protein
MDLRESVLIHARSASSRASPDVRAAWNTRHLAAPPSSGASSPRRTGGSGALRRHDACAAKRLVMTCVWKNAGRRVKAAQRRGVPVPPAVLAPRRPRRVGGCGGAARLAGPVRCRREEEDRRPPPSPPAASARRPRRSMPAGKTRLCHPCPARRRCRPPAATELRAPRTPRSGGERTSAAEAPARASGPRARTKRTPQRGPARGSRASLSAVPRFFETASQRAPRGARVSRRPAISRRRSRGVDLDPPAALRLAARPRAWPGDGAAPGVPLHSPRGPADYFTARPVTASAPGRGDCFFVPTEITVLDYKPTASRGKSPARAEALPRAARRLRGRLRASGLPVRRWCSGSWSGRGISLRHL